MNSVTVFIDGQKIYSFFETSLMFCGEKHPHLICQMKDFLPQMIINEYNEWAKKSTIDGTNEMKEIIIGECRYVFNNWYWD